MNRIADCVQSGLAAVSDLNAVEPRTRLAGSSYGRNQAGRRWPLSVADEQDVGLHPFTSLELLQDLVHRPRRVAAATEGEAQEEITPSGVTEHAERQVPAAAQHLPRITEYPGDLGPETRAFPPRFDQARVRIAHAAGRLALGPLVQAPEGFFVELDEFRSMLRARRVRLPMLRQPPERTFKLFLLAQSSTFEILELPQPACAHDPSLIFTRA